MRTTTPTPRRTGGGLKFATSGDGLAEAAFALHGRLHHQRPTGGLSLPKEKTVAMRSAGVPYEFQLHFWANRFIISDIRDHPEGGVRSAQLRKASIYWMIGEKDVYEMANIDSGALIELHLNVWNIPPGDPGMRRHNGGMMSIAATATPKGCACRLINPAGPRHRILWSWATRSSESKARMATGGITARASRCG